MSKTELRKAVEAVLSKAHDVACGAGEFSTYDDVFGDFQIEEASEDECTEIL